jgi:hypothetical protein
LPDEEPALSLPKGPRAILHHHRPQKEFPPPHSGDFDFRVRCGFRTKIRSADGAPGTGLFGVPRYTPSPSVYWNHRVSVKIRINLWSSITCGQNLDVKELTGRNLDDEDPKRDSAVSAHRHGLGYDRAIEMGGARSDVTMMLWICGPTQRRSTLCKNSLTCFVVVEMRFTTAHSFLVRAGVASSFIR